jgi:hypothetical protein
MGWQRRRSERGVHSEWCAVKHLIAIVCAMVGNTPTDRSLWIDSAAGQFVRKRIHRHATTPRDVRKLSNFLTQVCVWIVLADVNSISCESGTFVAPRKVQ